MARPSPRHAPGPLAGTNAQPREQIRRLRGWRVKAPPDTSIAVDLDRLTAPLAKQSKAVGGLDGAWDELCPDHLRGATRVGKLTPGGVLTMIADNDAVRYLMDQWLRAGGEAALRARCRTTLRRIKIDS